MSKEYIDREALETELNHRLNFLMAKNGAYDHYTSGFDECVDKVENFPSVDAVEVVRCKDCKYCDISLLLPSGRKMYTCMDGVHDHQMLMKPYDFCSDGKRREGADNA